MPSLTPSHLIRNRWMGTRASGPSRRPRTLPSSPGRTGRTGLGPPIISRFSSHLSLQILLLLKRASSSSDLSPSSPTSTASSPPKAPPPPAPASHSPRPPRRFPWVFSSLRSPCSGTLLRSAFPLRPQPNFSGSPSLRRLLLWVRGRGDAAARDQCWRRGLSGRVWVRILESVARLWVRSGGFGAVDLNCWFWLEEPGRQVAILLLRFGRSPFWVAWGSHA